MRSDVNMITVDFVMAKLGGVKIPTNPNRHKGGAFDLAQGGKATGSRWPLYSAQLSSA